MKKLMIAAILTAIAVQGNAIDLEGVNRSSLQGLEEIKNMVVPAAVPEKAALVDKNSKSGSEYLEGLNEELCPKPTFVGEYSAVCKVKDSSAIFKINLDQKNKVNKLPFNGYGITDLGLWPDDCTDSAFAYRYELFSAAGKKIGYAVFDGYVNSELQSRIKLLTKYTLDGKLASVTIIPWY